jgi:uncharacterized protein
MVRTDGGATGIRRAALFFLLTLGWSWGFWGVLALTGKDWTSGAGVLLYTLGGVGPLVAAALLVWRGLGVEPPGRFWRRAIDARRISPAWYAVILLVALVPNALPLLLPGGGGIEVERGFALVAMLLVAVLAGVAEEPGWRGYALDHLDRAMPALAAGLAIGLVWTLWHLPLYLMEGTIQQEEGLWSADFWVDMAARLPLAVLYAWVVLNTGRSILAAIVLHATGNLGSVLVGPEGDALILARLAILTAMAVLVVMMWGVDLDTGRRAGRGSIRQRPARG